MSARLLGLITVAAVAGCLAACGKSGNKPVEKSPAEVTVVTAVTLVTWAVLIADASACDDGPTLMPRRPSSLGPNSTPMTNKTTTTPIPINHLERDVPFFACGFA